MSTLDNGGDALEPPIFGGRTLADRAFEWLEEAIIKGDYPPGAKLDEVALAKSFGISRGPVREAIRRLEGKKLVNRVPNVGARVSTAQPSDLTDLLYVREALEGMACRLATERMTDAELAELAKLLEGHAAQRSLKAGDSYYQRPGDYDFHFRIIQGSRSAKLIEMLCDDLYYLLRIYRYRSSSRKGRAQESLREHQAVVKAMMARDPDAAEKAMRTHLRHALLSIQSEIKPSRPAAQAKSSRSLQKA
jgi:DNA-binding GntR family transcriptional regulator